MGARHCEWTESHLIVHFKIANDYICITFVNITSIKTKKNQWNEAKNNKSLMDEKEIS